MPGSISGRAAFAMLARDIAGSDDVAVTVLIHRAALGRLTALVSQGKRDGASIEVVAGEHADAVGAFLVVMVPGMSYSVFPEQKMDKGELERFVQRVVDGQPVTTPVKITASFEAESEATHG